MRARPAGGGSQSRDSGPPEDQSEDDWERASLGSAFDDASQDEWALVGLPPQRSLSAHAYRHTVCRSQTASPSGWDHLAELDVASGPSSGRSTPGLMPHPSSFAERTCAGPFSRGSRRRALQKPKL
eukprot:1058612-Prymnesium_polylepis.1